MSRDRRPAIPQTDPRANYLAHKAEIDAAIGRVLDSGWYILGGEVESFEQAFSAYIGVHHAIGVGNGTDALELALRACGVGPGDLVFTVSHTAVATVAAIELVGATPVLVDIDPVTYTMDPNCLEAALARPPDGTPKAVIPVHLYGHPADMPAILSLAQAHDLYAIEDCAQSHGAAVDGHKTGAWGHMAAFSFYPTKNLGALGDGGALATNDAHLAERARLLRQYGWRDRYISDLPGMNTRLDELQAAILRVKLRYLDGENARRRETARLYDSLLSGTDLILPRSRINVEHVYHQYVVRSQRRDSLRQFLTAHSIGTAIHYPSPIHLQPAYRGRIGTNVSSLRQSEQVCKEVLSLPMHPHITEEQVERICRAILLWHEQAEGSV